MSLWKEVFEVIRTRGCQQQTGNHQRTTHLQDPGDTVCCASLYQIILYQPQETLVSIFLPQPLRKWGLRPQFGILETQYHARGRTHFPFSSLCVPARNFTQFLIKQTNIYRWETVRGALISSKQCLNMCVDHLITRSGIYKHATYYPPSHIWGLKIRSKSGS